MSENLENKVVFHDGQIILLSLVGFDQSQIKTFFSYHRDQISQGKIRVCVSTHEFSSLPADVLQIVDVLAKRGIFEKEDATSWGALFQIDKIKSHKCYLIVRNMRFRREIVDAAKEAHVYINFLSIKEDGSLCQWTYNTSSVRGSRENSSTTSDSLVPQLRTDSFRICTKPSFTQILRINPKVKLSEKGQVSDGSRKYILEKKEMINNGAASYSTDVPGIWVKVYDAETLTSLKENKIKRMLSKPISDRSICWPISCAYDEDGFFRGYLFQEPKGEPLHMSVLKESGMQAFFPNWNRIQLAELLKTILQKIVLLHDKGIVIGCLNPASIRVVSQQEIYWIDTDDLQIEDFYTIASNLSFRPPEYINKQAYYGTLDSD